MKKLAQIILPQKFNEDYEISEKTSQDFTHKIKTSDKTPLILRKLSEIIEKADDVYNTISRLEESNEDTAILVESLYRQADDLYEHVDLASGIIPVQLDEALAWKLMNQNLVKLGFERIEHPSKDTYTTTKARIQHLFGIPMRAGKYADTFFVILDTDTKPYGIIDSEGTTFYENLGDALKELNKRAKMGDLEESTKEDDDDALEAKWEGEAEAAKLKATKLATLSKQLKDIMKKFDDGHIAYKEYKIQIGKLKTQFDDVDKFGESVEVAIEDSSLTEVLDPNDEAGVWIDDFVKSDDPKFADKSKEERIKMALGAWYAAQSK